MGCHYLNLHVPGVPIPQGSMRLVQGGRRMIHSNHAALMSWRRDVAHQAMKEMAHLSAVHHAVWPAAGPVGLIVTFNFERPLDHFVGRKRGVDRVRPVAPRDHYRKPDLDKLVRAIGDALTDCGAIVDDSQITVLRAAKRWTTEPAHATVQLETYTK